MVISETEYLKIKLKEVQGRYVTNKHIQTLLNQLSPIFKVAEIGISVERNPIQSVTFGNGPKRILMWSQMHGNESTTTKAVLDFINWMDYDVQNSSFFLEQCTFCIIPILNPDGAKAYTRVNANNIDLNRDAQDLSQPESTLLKKIYDLFKPHYCFNLHDQRTIFNVGATDKSATVSFLAPAFDKDRNISSSRELSMLLIAAMNKTLQNLIPGQVGRYDDGFNPNCVGDAFQMLNTPTILFEAGHYEQDYKREHTRKYIFNALVTGVNSIAKNTIKDFSVEDYLAIPENNKLYCDVLVKNAHTINTTLKKGAVVKVLYKEVLLNNDIKFIPTVLLDDTKSIQYGHKVIDCEVKQELDWLLGMDIFPLLN